MKQLLRISPSVLTMAAAVTCLFRPAHAQGSAQDIRSLKAQLKEAISEIHLLKSRLDRVERRPSQAGLVNTSARLARKKNAPEAPVASAAPTPVFVNFSHGLTVESLDHANSFHIGGRILIDGGASTQPERGLNSTANINQARLQVEGKFQNIWDYKLQYDFTGANISALSGSASTSAIGGIRDAYIALHRFEPLTLQIGNFFEPFGLERQTSKVYVSFLERGLATDIFSPSRHIGFAALANGSNWSLKGGIFSTSFEDKALQPAAETPVPYWINPKAGWVPTGGAQYFDVTGRATFAPINDGDQLFHFGLSGRYHRPNSSTAGNDDRVLALGSNAFGEANTLRNNMLGTPDLSCGAIAFGPNSGIPGKCVKDVLGYGAELALVKGPLSIQAEYLGAHYDRDAGALQRANLAGVYAPGGSSLTFGGFYAFGSWFLTGESRAASYSVKDSTGSNFRQIPIKHPLSAGGWGAVELLARYSSVDLNNGSNIGSRYANILAFAPNAATRTSIANAGVLGGQQSDVTLGVNWYLDPGFRLMANFVHVTNLTAPYDRPYLNGAHPNSFLMRAQVDW